jgi:DNA-binding transcriptional regulator YiaG
MSENTNITGRQIAAGRVLLGMAQTELAEAARISVATLRRMESSPSAATGYTNNILAVRTALEARGIEFLGNGEGGVRLGNKKPGG